MKFNSDYQELIDCGGHIFEVEFISWKMLNDILNFETEAE